jgi:hypothetical protein
MAVTIDGSASITINSGAVLGITSGTAVASTSGVSVDFTSLPSWIKRVTVMLSAVSTNGATGVFMRLGTSSGFESTGYNWWTSTNGLSTAGNTTYFQPGLRSTAASGFYGTVVLTLLDSATNLWVLQQQTTAGPDSADVYSASGSKALASTLTQIRLGSINGTSTFDAGLINIMYEG